LFHVGNDFFMMFQNTFFFGFTINKTNPLLFQFILGLVSMFKITAKRLNFILQLFFLILMDHLQLNQFLIFSFSELFFFSLLSLKGCVELFYFEIFLKFAVFEFLL